MIDVLLVEDDGRLRTALGAALAARGACRVAAAFGTTAEAARALAGGLSVDVALIDLGLPDGSGLVVVERAAATGAHVLVYTVFDDDDTILAALRAGARGYVLKSTPLRDVPSLLEAAARGEAPMSPVVARVLLEAWRTPDPGPPRPATTTFRPSAATTPPPDAVTSLTNRERDVLALLAKGRSYDAIGKALGIQHGTVQTHVKSLYAKLDVRSKAEAAVLASRLGIA